MLVVVNLDPNAQSGWVQLPLEELGLDPATPYRAHDLLSDTRYTWTGEWNFVQLDPAATPAHIFPIERPRDERDFDYYL